MKRRQFAKFCALLVSFTMIMTLVGCGKQATDAAATSADNTTKLNSMTLDEIIAEAKKVGKLDTVGMPDDRCNYGNLFNAIDSEYGLTHTDIDMSSSEQIALFKAEADSPTKDIGEVGQQNAQKVIDEGIVQAYKPTTWDSVPDWAKDTDGYWMIGYTGAVAIMTNTDKVGKAVTSFSDMLNGDYLVTIGDPKTESSAQHVVLAAAYAMGGDVNNLVPAMEFFQKLAKAGRLDPGSNEMQRFAKGESEVLLHWDYQLIGYRNNIHQDDPNMNMEIHIPTDGSVASGYITIINKYAPHPAAAALVREYLFSDEGQINVARAGARPVRDVELPADVVANMIPEAEYTNVLRTIDFQQDWITASATIGDLWDEYVTPYMS